MAIEHAPEASDSYIRWQEQRSKELQDQAYKDYLEMQNGGVNNFPPD